MSSHAYHRLPPALFDWINFLCKALPARSIRTFLELLIAAMLTPTGFVTDAYLILDMQNHWTSYYKWLQNGKWSWLGLARQFCRLALQVMGVQEVFLAIDDHLVLRKSKKAPGSQIHHQHGSKPNLAKYVQGQCWVSLGMSVRRSTGEPVSLPLLTRLIPSAGNTGKLIAANTLIRAVCHLLHGKVTVLVDSWYMRKTFIASMLKRKFNVIGQARIDTRLYDLPPKRKKGQRGAPRKYGDKYTKKRIAHLKKTEATLHLYGRDQCLRYRSRQVLARFLEGVQVTAVWCEFQNKDGHWNKTRLLLSTDLSLTPEAIIQRYALRWPIETMFNQLKNGWGLKETWQQTRQTLHRWVHINMVSFGLLQLLSCFNHEAVQLLCNHSPWRKDNPITPGQIRKGLLPILMHVKVRDWWNATCKKFQPPDSSKNEAFTLNSEKAA